MLLLNLWLSVTIGRVQSHAWLCLNLITFPSWLDLIISNLIILYNSFQSDDLTKLIPIPYSLFL